MPSVLIINDTSDHDNWGSQACADALRQIITVAIPDVEIKSVYSEWISRKYLTVDLPLFGHLVRWKRPNKLYRYFARPFDFLPRAVDQFDWYADKWLAGECDPGAKEYLEQLAGIDAVVFNAEGSTYRNNWTATKSIFMLWLAKTRFDIPALFVNGSLTITTVDRILPGMIRKTFSVLDGIAIREPISFRNLRDYCPDIEAELVPDTVFYMTGEPLRQVSAAFEATRNRIGNVPYFCFSLSMLPMDYRPNSTASSLHHLIIQLKQLGLQAVLMAKDRSDLFLKDLALHTDSVFFGPEHGYDDLRMILRDSTFLLSGRYHHTILAAMERCPAITLTTTSHKMEGLVELLANTVCGPYDATDLWSHMQRIISDAQDLLENRIERGERLFEVASQLKNNTLRLGQMVSGALKL